MADESNVEELMRERDEYKEKYLRKLAEMDNYRKMLEREKSMELEKCRANIIKEFLEPYENLRRATDSGIEGIEPIFKQMRKILESFGVREIEAKGKKFDPEYHEAIAIVEGEEEGLVVDVYQIGYMLGDTVLRHAKVLVSKKKEASKNE
jgi:molecular chaperone GrpE